jgi:C4-dicarboxylate transporter DctQ subunit
LRSRILRAYRASIAGLCAVTAAALVAVVVLVLASVAVRYLGIFPGSLHWTSELTRFGIVWIAMLGAAIGLDRGAHVAIDLVEQLPATPRRVVATGAYLLGVVFLAVLVVSGLQLSLATMRQLSPALKIPVGYAYLAIPVGGAIMLIQSVLFAFLPAARRASMRGDEPGNAAVG